jgi:hypothetical protein
MIGDLIYAARKRLADPRVRFAVALFATTWGMTKLAELSGDYSQRIQALRKDADLLRQGNRAEQTALEEAVARRWGGELAPDAAGLAAYLAYGRATGGKTWDGRIMPAWAELGDGIRAAWLAAAGAVATVDRPDPVVVLATNPDLVDDPDAPIGGGDPSYAERVDARLVEPRTGE